MEKVLSNNKRLILLFKPFIKDIILISFCLLFSTLINLFIPIINQKLMDYGLIAKNYSNIVIYSSALLIFFLFNFFLKLHKEKKRVEIESTLRKKLFSDAFEHMLKIKINYFDKRSSDEIFSNINNDVNTITMIAKDEAIFAITQVFNIVGGLIGLSLIDYRLMLIVLFFIPIKLFIVNIISKKRTLYFENYIQESENNAKFWGDSISGISEIKIFGISSFKEKTLNKLLNKLCNCTKKIDYLNEINMELDDIILQGVLFLVYILGGILIIHEQMTIGAIFSFITYATYILSPISAVLNIAYLFSGIKPSAKRYFDFMDIDEEIVADNNNNEVSNKDLTFKNISFQYNDNNNVFGDLNFTIPYGKKIAIVGENGAGKTTLLNLILRLREPQNGEILIGNKNINTIPVEQYRLMFGTVNQKIHLFNDTIYNNLCLYQEPDNYDLEKLISISGLKEFIDKVSLNYIVGTEGSMLSGGQRQKIALVRALIRNTPFIIFDEVTSNIDSISTQNIINLLSTELKEKTVILVTHDLNTLKYVDYILVLKEGEINGIGNFETLKTQNTLFQKLLKSYE